MHTHTHICKHTHTHLHTHTPTHTHTYTHTHICKHTHTHLHTHTSTHTHTHTYTRLSSNARNRVIYPNKRSFFFPWLLTLGSNKNNYFLLILISPRGPKGRHRLARLLGGFGDYFWCFSQCLSVAGEGKTTSLLSASFRRPVRIEDFCFLRGKCTKLGEGDT